MERNRLPVGSIITIRKEELLYMIIGYDVEFENNETKDYCLVEYPFGFKGSNSLTFIDEEYIKEVRFEGYRTKVFEKLNKYLNEK